MDDSKPVILFVDDEVGLLDGIRRSLFVMRKDWTMLFAVGAQEALDILERQRVGAVVSDMRMPGMDGATLLRHVRTTQPWAARIVLSGFAEQEAIMRTIGPAHLYFSKPCNPQALVNGIRRAMSVRERLQSPQLQALVAGANVLPALPESLTRLLTELGSAKGSAAEVARIIGEDVGLTATLLKVTNSSFFYVPTTVADVTHAVRILGFDMVRELVLVAGIFEGIDRSCLGLPMIQRLVRRSLEIGRASRGIVEAEGLPRATAEHAHCAGMLAHVGSLLLMAKQPGLVREVQHELESSDHGIVIAERNTFGASHAEISAALLCLWGFTDPIIEAVLYHHEPSRAEHLSPESPLFAVHAAQHLIKPLPDQAQPERFRLSGLDVPFLRGLGKAGRIADWAEIAGKMREELE